MKQISLCVLLLLLSFSSYATPSSTYWATSTASCQAWNTPHLTYDSYFRQGPNAGSAGSPNYPTDVGLTTGFLPFEKIQGEIGFDMLLPSQEPLYVNAKLCTPESSVFAGSPAIGFGIYNVGFKKDINDYNVLYLVMQKSMPADGYVSLGVYHGQNKTLFTNSDGAVVDSGLLAGMTSPDIEIGLKGLKKINFVADIQTGKNALGAWGLGANVYFTDNISILTGPVYFLDRNLQTANSEMLWTLQLDVDILL